jgi:hypothetical protein
VTTDSWKGTARALILAVALTRRDPSAAVSTIR